jgi:hypothetical protein
MQRKGQGAKTAERGGKGAGALRQEPGSKREELGRENSERGLPWRGGEAARMISRKRMVAVHRKRTTTAM